MNFRSLFFAPLFFAPLVLLAQSSDQPPAPPPVAQLMPAGPAAPRPATEQRVYGPTSDTLLAPQAVQGIVEKFRAAYKTDHAPRVVIYVNRALVDTSASSKSTAALADQQTVREVERLFGRAFRNAGAQLADQKVAASLLPDQPGARLANQAAKDREALANVADIAIEVLISSRTLVVPEVSGDSAYNVPDIQATAIRLKDSAIIGQAAASDILGRNVQAGRIIRQFGVPDITEATAIALMEDMLTK